MRAWEAKPKTMTALSTFQKAVSEMQNQTSGKTGSSFNRPLSTAGSTPKTPRKATKIPLPTNEDDSTRTRTRTPTRRKSISENTVASGQRSAPSSNILTRRKSISENLVASGQRAAPPSHILTRRKPISENLVATDQRPASPPIVQMRRKSPAPPSNIQTRRTSISANLVASDQRPASPSIILTRSKSPAPPSNIQMRRKSISENLVASDQRPASPTIIETRRKTPAPPIIQTKRKSITETIVASNQQPAPPSSIRKRKASEPPRTQDESDVEIIEKPKASTSTKPTSTIGKPPSNIRVVVPIVSDSRHVLRVPAVPETIDVDMVIASKSLDTTFLERLFNRLSLQHKVPDWETSVQSLQKFLSFEMLSSPWKLWLRLNLSMYRKDAEASFMAVAVMLQAKPDSNAYKTITELFKAWRTEIQIWPMCGPWKEGSCLINFGSQKVKDQVQSGKRLAGGVFCGDPKSGGGGSVLLFEAQPDRSYDENEWRLQVEAFNIPAFYERDLGHVVKLALAAISTNTQYGIEAVLEMKKNNQPLRSVNGGRLLELVINRASVHMWTYRELWTGLTLLLQGFRRSGEDLIPVDAGLTVVFKTFSSCRFCSLPDPMGQHRKAIGGCPIRKIMNGLLESLAHNKTIDKGKQKEVQTVWSPKAKKAKIPKVNNTNIGTS